MDPKVGKLGEVAKMVMMIEMGDRKAGKLVKKVETEGMKVEKW